jgi:hypothetical protein
MDFNANGNWNDPGEQVLVNQSVTTGTNNLTVAIPSGATAGTTFARFRLTSGVGYGHGGIAPDGEVEDYQITIVAAFSGGDDAGEGEGGTPILAVGGQSQPASPASGSGSFSSVAPAHTDIVDLAIEQVVAGEHEAVANSEALEDHESLVDQVFEDEDSLLGNLLF